MTSRKDRLAQTADNYRNAKGKLNDARKDLSKEVRGAAKEGMRQVDILQATDHVWTREQVRKIVASEDDD
jgi:hypothetical protein